MMMEISRFKYRRRLPREMNTLILFFFFFFFFRERIFTVTPEWAYTYGHSVHSIHAYRGQWQIR